jgi:hypothetical protein
VRALLAAAEPPEPNLSQKIGTPENVENLSSPSPNSKVITPHSNPLTSQLTQRKLAVFSARLGILRIEGKKKSRNRSWKESLAAERGFFYWFHTNRAHEPVPQPSNCCRACQHRPNRRLFKCVTTARPQKNGSFPAPSQATHQPVGNRPRFPEPGARSPEPGARCSGLE